MRVFFDSNVFIKHLAGVKEAKKLIDKIEHGEWRGYVSDIVVSEVVYGYLRLVLNVSRYKLRDYTVKHVDEVKELIEQDVYPLFIDFECLPTSVGISELLKYIVSYRLLPNDALIAATCKTHGVDTIATFDDDFRRIPWLRVVREG